MDASYEDACDPSAPTLMRSVVACDTSRTKTSSVPFVSDATKFDAADTNATNRPSALMTAERLSPFPSPDAPVDMSVVVLVCRSTR